jgi:UDP-glucose 4-epimerase
LKILVTGAQGFVGSILVKHLLRKPDVALIAIGRQPQASANGMVFVEADLDCSNWTSILPGPVDVIIHLAQSGRYGDFPGGARDMVRINIDATAELLDWAIHNGVSKFILASTGNVYQAGSSVLDESSLCCPTGMYAATKLSAEHIALSYRDLLAVTVVRPFGVFGPSQKRGLFYNLLKRVRDGTPVAVAGGTGLRISPIYIDDCVEAFARLALRPIDGSGLALNLGGVEHTNIREIATIISQVGGWQPVFVEISGVADCMICDSRKLFSLLQWIPETSILQGIVKMVDGDTETSVRT